MHAKSRTQADKSKQSSGPSGVEAHQQGQAAEQMDRYLGPDYNIGRRHVNAGEILRRAPWIAHHDDAVPNKQARHQQSGERRQECFAVHSVVPFRIWAMWMNLIGTPMRSAQPRWCIRHELSAEMMYSAPARA